MRRGADIAVEHPGLYLVHQNLPGKEVAAHRHREHLVFVPLHGEIAVTLAGDTLRAGPGRLIYLPPKVEHAFASSQAQGERLIALIAPEAWRQAGAAETSAPALLPTLQLGKELLFHLLLHPDTRHPRALVQVFVQTLSEALEVAAPEPALEHLDLRASDPRVARALDYLRANLDQPLPLAAIARHAGLSTRNLSRKFRVELGHSPKELVTRLRVERAAELLESGQRSVTEVALAVGYGSLSRFITVFRQHTGQLPSEVARLGPKRQVIGQKRKAGR